MLWAGFFALEAEESEYASTHKGKQRPIGGNKLSLEEYCRLHGKQ